MLHGPSAELNEDKSADKKAKLGLKFFFVYLFLYAFFVFLCVYKPELIGQRVFLGLNLAVVYGFFLIILAVIFGFIYNFLCTRLENKFNEGKEVWYMKFQ